MTRAGSQLTELDKRAEQLASLILGGSNAEAQALAVVREDDPSIRPLPIVPKRQSVKSDWTRAKALKILELRTQGLSFDGIAEQLGYKSGKHVRAAYARLMDKHEREDVENLRALQNERIEMAWRGLAPKIAQGRERAVEVGMKVLERQSRLMGLDKADQLVEKSTGQPIQINIMAHPGDPKAQAMIIEHEPLRLEENKENA
jgi:hypothetical protein